MFHITSAWQTTSQQQQPKWLQISRTVPNVVLVLPNHGPACLHKCPAAFISEPQDFVPSSEKYKVLDTQAQIKTDLEKVTALSVPVAVGDFHSLSANTGTQQGSFGIRQKDGEESPGAEKKPLKATVKSALPLGTRRDLGQETSPDQQRGEPAKLGERDRAAPRVHPKAPLTSSLGCLFAEPSHARSSAWVCAAAATTTPHAPNEVHTA
ncbi:hypothetical protein Anapl_13396 [Anas platyrhynchos]|uniref:Uncharacterized protein n=1 Tax=Anas platyrhynchos TaxID=8839 RepID=R0KZT1_ANAPL|nr:hypothetical protein Anapl_13396 [Anas platyrhynchos]